MGSSVVQRPPEARPDLAALRAHALLRGDVGDVAAWPPPRVPETDGSDLRAAIAAVLGDLEGGGENRAAASGDESDVG